jgi:hypothetical protein
MRVISAETQQLIDEVNDIDYGYIGPYEKCGDNEVKIEALLLDHGLYIDSDADCIQFIEDEDEDDDSIRGDDDDDDELMCDVCGMSRPPDQLDAIAPNPLGVEWVCKLECAPDVIAWCSECRCLSTFAYDQNREDEPGPDDPNLICGFCGCAIDPAALEEPSMSSPELDEAIVSETPLVVRRWPERGPGACYPIDGWVDGQTEAVITWRGTNG